MSESEEKEHSESLENDINTEVTKLATLSKGSKQVDSML